MKKIISFLFAIFVFIAPAIACETNEIDVLGNGTQCETAHFTLTTTSTDSFQFTLSAEGTFYVDCGNGGTLKQGNTTLSNKTISRGSSTSNTTYTCTWDAADTQTIRFGGRATEYSDVTTTAVISFSANAQKVYSITGDLGKIFGAVQSGRVPHFYNTFSNCSNLTTIPGTLFVSIDTSNATNTSYMFYGTFGYCSKITDIPSGLFNSVDTSNATNTRYMFQGTFASCSNLTAIPSGLFNSIDTSNATDTYAMFRSTFNGCRKITAMPASLFNSNINMAKATNRSNMFSSMFNSCTSMTGYIPSTTFPDGITAALNASSNVFADTQLATTCPGGTQLYATYTPNSKVACEALPASKCSAGQYLPMNTSDCATCPTNGICPGGTYTLNDTTVQGITGCDVGYTLSVDVCDANIISVIWDHADTADITENDAGSVTYGGDIRTPKRAQHINGKIFTGWVFNTPSGN